MLSPESSRFGAVWASQESTWAVQSWSILTSTGSSPAGKDCCSLAEGKA